MSGARRSQLQIVWFKRDLRVADNAVLAAASQAGPVLPLYIIEPELWRQPDMSARQWAFATECLGDLRQDLADLGQPLCLRSGDAVDVLAELQAAYGMDALWSHEETGNAWTYARDRRVAAWCRDRGTAWHEMPQNGVIRRLKSRTGWAKAWDRRMAEPQVDAPALEPVDVETGGVPTAADLHLDDDGCTQRQIGGRAVAVDLLHSFLARRGETYRSAMANPIQGAEACSRLSPHLAWGTVSMREVSQATRARAETAEGAWKGAMTSFNGRLHWHCHFMQKLEDAPRLEFENLHPAYNGLRPSMPDAARLAAWEAGETGLPFVDACMRSLRATGWLNFRMRAMLIAV
ncbi:MAG: deoxyribodipyrimidine photo-lyase, partial [Pseudomonadota bacterium]